MRTPTIKVAWDFVLHELSPQEEEEFIDWFSHYGMWALAIVGAAMGLALGYTASGPGRAVLGLLVGGALGVVTGFLGTGLLMFFLRFLLAAAAALLFWALVAFLWAH